MRWLPVMLAPLLLFVVGLRGGPAPAHAQSAAPAVYGYSGFATYYGIEDGVVAGDVMYDGTPYDPSDPTIAAASLLFPLHTWLRVCQPARCIVVQVRDRGLLDQNNVLIDLSRAAYTLLFGQLGGKAWVSAYFSDPYSLGVDAAPVITNPLPGGSLTAPAPAPPLPAASFVASVPSASPVPVTASPPPVPNTISLPHH